MIKKIKRILILVFSLPELIISLVTVTIWPSHYKLTAIAISKINGVRGQVLRNLFYRFTLKSCGKDIKVFHGSYVVYRDTQIGNRCTIEEDSIVSLCTIGNDVIIAAKCTILSGKNHHEVDNLDLSFYDTASQIKNIKLGNNLWIGVGSIIMEDVSSGTAVGAGSVVNKKFEPNVIIAGNPAKLIRKRGINAS